MGSGPPGHRLAESIPWNRFLGSVKVLKIPPLFDLLRSSSFFFASVLPISGISQVRLSLIFLSSWISRLRFALIFLIFGISRGCFASIFWSCWISRVWYTLIFLLYGISRVRLAWIFLISGISRGCFAFIFASSWISRVRFASIFKIFGISQVWRRHKQHNWKSVVCDLSTVRMGGPRAASGSV